MIMNASNLIPPQSPPSTYAIAAYVDGSPGSWYRVLKLTAVRSLMIGSGLYAVGFRNDQLIKGSIASSIAITAWLMIGYKAELKEKSQG